MGDFHISGCLPDVYDHGMVHVRFRQIQSQGSCALLDYTLAAMRRCDPSGSKKQSVYLARDMSVVYEHVDNCRDVLEHLLHLIGRAFQHRCRFIRRALMPMPVPAWTKRKPRRLPWARLIAVMQGSQYKPGEIEEPYMNFYFDDTSPLDEAFEHMALDFFEPLFKHHTSKAFTPRLQ